MRNDLFPFCHHCWGPHPDYDCPLVPGKMLRFYRLLAEGIQARKSKLTVKMGWLDGLRKEKSNQALALPKRFLRENERRTQVAIRDIAKLKREIVSLYDAMANGPPGG